MTPHIKEDVRRPTDETAEINLLERIFYLFWEKPEKVVNTKDGFTELSLPYINN